MLDFDGSRYVVGPTHDIIKAVYGGFLLGAVHGVEVGVWLAGCGKTIVTFPSRDGQIPK